MDSEKSPLELQTEWSERRTFLAVEATFAGWLRTGMAALGVAIGLHAVLNGGSLLARGTAAGFVALAVLIFLLGHRAARSLIDELHQERQIRQSARFLWLTVLFVLISLAVGALLLSDV